jgi:hypothetical protein
MSTSLKDIALSLLGFFIFALVVGGIMYACSDKSDKNTETKERKCIFESDTILKYLFLDENEIWHTSNNCWMLDGESAYSYKLKINRYEFNTWNDVIRFLSTKRVCSHCFSNDKLEELKEYFDEINKYPDKVVNHQDRAKPYGEYDDYLD